MTETTQGLFSVVNTFHAGARFNAKDLVGLSLDILKGLCAYGPSTVSPPAVQAAGQKLTGGRALGWAEMQLVTVAIANHNIGASSTSSGYEERMWPKDGTVDYCPKTITLNHSDNTTTVLANTPVVMEPMHSYRPGTRHVLPIVTILCDMNKGELVQIISMQNLTALFGGVQSSIFPSAVVGLLQQVRLILTYHPQWSVSQTGKTTMKGQAFVDFFVQAVDKAPLATLLTLHKMVCENFVKGIEKVPLKKESEGCKFYHRIQMVKQRAVDPSQPPVDVPMVDQNSLFRLEKKLLTDPEDQHSWDLYVREFSHVPILLVGPIRKYQVFFSAEQATNVTALTAKRDFATNSGGPKRGLGYIAKNVNYNPNQSETTRSVNLIIGMILGAWKQGKNLIDVRVPKGIVVLVAQWLAKTFGTADSVGIRILLLEAKTANQAKGGAAWFVYKQREGAIQVWIDEKASLPEVNGKKGEPAALAESAAEGYVQMINSMAPSGFVVWCPVYSEAFFKAGRVHRLKYAHDMCAIFTSVEGFGLVADYGKGEDYGLKSVARGEAQDWEQVAAEFDKNADVQVVTMEQDKRAAFLETVQRERAERRTKHRQMWANSGAQVTYVNEIIEPVIATTETASDAFYKQVILSIRALNVFIMHPFATCNVLGTLYSPSGSGIKFVVTEDGWTYVNDSIALEIAPSDTHGDSVQLAYPIEVLGKENKESADQTPEEVIYDNPINLNDL